MPDPIRTPSYRDLCAQCGSERRLLRNYVQGALPASQEVAVEVSARPEMIIATALGLLGDLLSTWELAPPKPVIGPQPIGDLPRA